jgi:hypothetical protein
MVAGGVNPSDFHFNESGAMSESDSEKLLKKIFPMMRNWKD